MMTCKKNRLSQKDALEFSGGPVRQVQEELFRDKGLNIGSWPRWLVAASLISHPSSGRMLERPNSPNGREDRDMAYVILLHCNNEIKAGLPVSLSPDFDLALCPNDRGSGLHFFQEERER